ncbi:MAG: hypothetical protein NW208_17055 [Bryobacter sp.]|nr:hypothetical protein [Bryobacter sp.]
MEDNQTLSFSAAKLFAGEANVRDRSGLDARLAAQFVEQNEANFAKLNCRWERDFDGAEVRLIVHTQNTVGAVPLLSPRSGKYDFGLTVLPRFSWASLGGLLGEMGWRVAPSPLRLPLLPRSTRRVPKWVISSMVLARLDALVKQAERRFESTCEELRAPRGSVDWTTYAQASLPRARFLALPCRFPDLKRDQHLAGAIRFTLQAHRDALESQRAQGAFALQLLRWCEELLALVSFAAPLRPTATLLEQWKRSSLRSPAFREGIESIAWTVDDRNLAGTSDLEGLPWALPMDAFFEAWLEAVAEWIGKQSGGHMQAGRKRETHHALDWVPALPGAQRALIPDLWLQWSQTTLILDAKYKRHWEDMADFRGPSREDLFREQHRQDLLQALAYSSLTRSKRVITCLAYPCHLNLWHSLLQRNRLIHRAHVGPVGEGGRQTEIWLTALPLAGPIPEVALPLLELLREEQVAA